MVMVIRAENVRDVNLYAGYLAGFTECFKRHYPENKFMAEAACIRAQIPVFFKEVADDDLFAGRAEYPALGFSPQVYTKRSGFAYYAETEKILELASSKGIDKDLSLQLKEAADFWRNYDSVLKTRELYPSWVKNALPEDDWIGTPGIAFPLYRMGGSQLNFDGLMEEGIVGLQSLIQNRRQESKDRKAIEFYDAALYSLETFTLLCDAYIESLKPKNDDSPDVELMIRSLQHIRVEKPVHFHEAIQLAFLYNVLSGSQNYGRMDEYLGDFFVRDIESGYINEETAFRYLESLWRIMEDRGTIYDGRVIIGGRGRRNTENADRLALLIMRVAGSVKTILPQLSLRFHQDQDPQLYTAALNTLSEGYVYPMLYNDEVNIAAVAKAFNVSEEIAVDYLPFGCGEYTLYHRSFDSPNGIINLAHALECLLAGGRDPVTGEERGIPVNPDAINSFDELISLYKKQVEFHIEALAMAQKIGYESAAATTPFLYLSLLYNDCIEKGRSLFDGGISYLGGSVETYGNTNVADSLYALKRACFEEDRFSLEHIRNMLAANFKAYTEERNYLQNLPKYGNDHEGVDEIYTELHTHVCEFTRSLAQKNGLHHYVVVIINNDANTDLGFLTGALPDGRLQGEGLNNGNSPVPGRDRMGITAFLNSILKPDTHIHGGAVQNIKFSKEMFNRYRAKTESLLQTYFRSGGAQAMITVVGREDLENALEEPEKYRNLVVRVGGFSARFVELRKEVQMEIIQRTLY